MSQTELAVRAGITQSVISAYESGHRQPAIPTLTALIEATGHELVLSLRQEPDGLARLSGPVGRRVRRNRHKLVAAAAAHGITGLHVLAAWPVVKIVLTAMSTCSRIFPRVLGCSVWDGWRLSWRTS